MPELTVVPRPCPVCSSVEAGCLGTVGDGRILHCADAALAGAIQSQLWKGRPAYAHRAKGACPCGREHAPKGNGAATHATTPRPEMIQPVGRDTSAADHDVEQSVLGALLIAPERLATLELRASAFDLPRHRILFQAMKRLATPNAIELSIELERAGDLAAVGGRAFLGKLMDYPTAAYLESHAKKLRELELRRALIAHAERVQMRANERNDTAEELQAFVETSLREVEHLREGGGRAETLEMALERSSVARFREPAKALSWVVDRLIPEKAVGLLAGAGGCGKGHLLQQLGLSCATGLNFGPFRVEKACGILYVSWEDDAEELHRRFEAGLRAMWIAGVHPDELAEIERYFHQADVCGHAATLDKRLITGLVRRVETIPDCRLIVLDPLVRLLPPLENGLSINSQEGAGRVHELLGQLQKATGCSIIAAHHDSKAGRTAAVDDPNAATGSAQLVDLARFSMRMRAMDAEGAASKGLDPHARYVELGLAKANRGPGIGESVVWKRQSGGALAHVEVRSLSDLDVAAASNSLADLGQATGEQWQKKSGLPKHRFNAAKATLIASGDVAKVLPNGTRRNSAPTYSLRLE